MAGKNDVVENMMRWKSTSEDTSSVLGFGAPTCVCLLMASSSSPNFSFTHSFQAESERTVVNHEGEGICFSSLLVLSSCLWKAS